MIAGNIGTAEAAKKLADEGADALKVVSVPDQFVQPGLLQVLVFRSFLQFIMLQKLLKDQEFRL